MAGGGASAAEAYEAGRPWRKLEKAAEMDTIRVEAVAADSVSGAERKALSSAVGWTSIDERRRIELVVGLGFPLRLKPY